MKATFFNAYVSGIISNSYVEGMLLFLLTGFAAAIFGLNRIVSRRKKETSLFIPLTYSAMFHIGYIAVFVFLASTTMNFWVWLPKAKGPIFLITGLAFLIPAILMLTGRKKALPNNSDALRWLGLIAAGMIISLFLPGIIGPVRAQLLYLVQQDDQLLLGIMLLIVHGLGIATPALLAALPAGFVFRWISTAPKLAAWLNIIAAAMLMATGAMMLKAVI